MVRHRGHGQEQRDCRRNQRENRFVHRNPGSGVYINGRRLDSSFNLLHSVIKVSQIGTNSLERALALLETIEKTPGGLRNAEISRQLHIPKSTCSWILARLERQGYLSF